MTDKEKLAAIMPLLQRLFDVRKDTTEGTWEREDFDPTRVQCAYRGEMICDTRCSTEKGAREIISNAIFITEAANLIPQIQKIVEG